MLVVLSILLLRSLTRRREHPKLMSFHWGQCFTSSLMMELVLFTVRKMSIILLMNTTRRENQ